MSLPGASCGGWPTRPEAGSTQSKTCNSSNPRIRRSPRNCALITRCLTTPRTRDTTASGEIYESKLIVPVSSLKPDQGIARLWIDSALSHAGRDGAALAWDHAPLDLNLSAFTISSGAMIHIVDS